MDGIEITQVVDEETPIYLDISTTPSFTNNFATSNEPFEVFDPQPPITSNSWLDEDEESDELAAEEIADMIRINEGPQELSGEELSSPQFKHLEKLNTEMPHQMQNKKSLKKSFLNKEVKRPRKTFEETDEDEDDVFVQPKRMKIKHKLEEERRYLKELIKKRKELELENQKLEKERIRNVKQLKEEMLLINKIKMNQVTPKRGRPYSGKKLFEKLGIDEGFLESSESKGDLEVREQAFPTFVKTRSGRMRKTNAGLNEYIVHSKVANFVYSGGIDPSNGNETPQVELLSLPIKKKDGRGRKKGWRKHQGIILKKAVVENSNTGKDTHSMDNSLALPHVSDKMQNESETIDVESGSVNADIEVVKNKKLKVLKPREHRKRRKKNRWKKAQKLATFEVTDDSFEIDKDVKREFQESLLLESIEAEVSNKTSRRNSSPSKHVKENVKSMDLKGVHLPKSDLCLSSETKQIDSDDISANNCELLESSKDSSQQRKLKDKSILAKPDNIAESDNGILNGFDEDETILSNFDSHNVDPKLPRNKRTLTSKVVMSYTKKRKNRRKQVRAMGYGKEIKFVDGIQLDTNESEVAESDCFSFSNIKMKPVLTVCASEDEVINTGDNQIKRLRSPRLTSTFHKTTDLELSRLRPTWDKLLSSPENSEKRGVENNSPPDMKSSNPKSLSTNVRKSLRGRKSLNKIEKCEIVEPEPLKEKQNIGDKAFGVELRNTRKRSDKPILSDNDSKEKELRRKTKINLNSSMSPLVRANPISLDPNFLTNDNKLLPRKRSRRSGDLSKQNAEIKADSNNCTKLEKDAPIVQEETMKSRRRTKGYFKEDIAATTAIIDSKRPRRSITKPRARLSDSNSPRRSSREIKFTKKMADIIQAGKQGNTEKSECYDHILKRGTNVPSNLQEKVDILSKYFDSSWGPGDLVWTEVGKKVFWPSLVIQDPFSCDEYSKIKRLGGDPQVFVHVQFLHEQGKRGWIPSIYIQSFEGSSQYKSLSTRMPDSSELCFIDLKDAFIVGEKCTKKWDEAVKEGESLLKKSPSQRLSYIRRKCPLERYGDCSTLDAKVTDIAEDLDPLPLPSPADTNKCIPVKKPRSKKKEITEDKLDSKNSKRASKKLQHTKVLQISESLRNERAPSEDSTSAFEKESTSSLELLSYETKKAKRILFKKVRDVKVCDICLYVKDEKIVQCKGLCLGNFHPSCLEKAPNMSSPKKEKINLDNWMCNSCVKGENPCFVCKKADGLRQKCSIVGCGNFYHNGCLKLFPQTKFNRGVRMKNNVIQRELAGDENCELPPEITFCSLHTCHTCSSENPADAEMVTSEKLVRCVKCPTAYHSGYFCVPADTEVLTTSQILCGKHYIPESNSRVQHHYNINWCFICCKGGTLICCDNCPSSFHVDCLKLKPPEEGYVCEECESGRFPLHGELVWVKFGAYRWWPAKVLYPQEIPENVEKARKRKCEFAVQFYGTRDYQWINRGRAFLYQEGDALEHVKTQKRYDKSYQKAIQEAVEDFVARKEALSLRKGGKNGGKPPPYKKIKTNRYVAKALQSNQEPLVCECDPEGESPCGPNSNCLNRMMLVECNPNLCPASSACLNQAFQKRQYAPLQTFKAGEKGWGLKSTIDLTKGQFVIEYIGEVIDEEEFKIRMQRKLEIKDTKFYFLTLESNRIIDAGCSGNLARFMNHSCSPNCDTEKWTVNGTTRVGLFASEDIPKGTELTFNYNLDCCGEEKKKACHCESVDCTGFIGSKASKVQADKEKLKKAKDKIKKRKKKLKTVNKGSDSVCFKCGVDGELMICDASQCTRVCHVNCAGLEAWPIDPWYCESHVCSVCKKSTKRKCSTCGIAYCAYHTQGFIYTDDRGALFCNMHINQSERSRQGRTSSYVNRRDPDEVTNSTNSLNEEASCKSSTRDDEKQDLNGIEESLGSLDAFPSIDNLVSPNTDDLVPVTDLLDSNASLVFTDPDGNVVEVQQENDDEESKPTPAKRRRLTNIPRSKVFPCSDEGQSKPLMP